MQRGRKEAQKTCVYYPFGSLDRIAGLFQPVLAEFYIVRESEPFLSVHGPLFEQCALLLFKVFWD